MKQTCYAELATVKTTFKFSSVNKRTEQTQQKHYFGIANISTTCINSFLLIVNVPTRLVYDCFKCLDSPLRLESNPKISYMFSFFI